MTTLTLYDEAAPHAAHGLYRDHAEIVRILALTGVQLERWTAEVELAGDASDTDIVAAYRSDIARLQAAGGYQSCDVVRLTPDNPDRAALRTKFLAEHVHDDDEVRFFVEGAALFYIRHGGLIHALECVRGDLINLPAGTRHWFDTGEYPRFTAIRLFITPEGWVARYTGDPIAGAIPLYEGAL